MTHICEDCGAVLSDTGYFFNHLNNKHNKNLSKEEFYDLYLRKSPDDGKCLKCRCTDWIFSKKWFSFYI